MRIYLKMQNRESLCFDDLLLVPQFSDIESRKEIDIGNTLSDIKFTMPVISAPMDTVTETVMAHTMNKYGGLGIIHRYNTIDEQTKFVRRCVRGNKTENVAAAIGVTGDFLERAIELTKAGAKIICVDVAHGHHVMMRYALEVLKNTFGDTPHIMAGNVATLRAFNDLADWGADSIRVGIGGGSICSTRIQTGHGIPTLQSIIECAQTSRDAKIIADGGIKSSGDIVKALAAGADFVIVGSLLAGTTQSPGEVYYKDGQKLKTYRGMASEEAQKDWRGAASSLEGVSTSIPYKGHAGDILKEIKRGIRSGLSYSGARNLTELRAKSQFIKQTQASQIESDTHIRMRY
jgi:IMP dehydrogenase